ncbi:MAG: COX15/CtaA family protein [Gemmatimonadaceae bacterium]
MIAIRRLGWLALVLAYGQIVFGAIVRITGSGMGCGDSWPTCAGAWLPPLERPDLIIEVTHRYIAAALTIVIAALALTAFVRRRMHGFAGLGGVLRPALLAAATVIATALLGAVTVWLHLTNKGVIVAHLTLAMALLAVLLVVIVRAGGLAPRSAALASRTSGTEGSSPSGRSTRGALIAAGLVFITIVLGALTANLPGANTACTGFPLCSGSWVPTDSVQHVQYAHRVLAFLLLLHSGALALGVARRGETVLVGLARLTFVTVLLQIGIAAALVQLRLPWVLRSLHEAVGTLLWLAAAALAIVAVRQRQRRHAAARSIADVVEGAAAAAEARA